MSAAPDDRWNDERVARWLRQAEALERQLAPVSTVVLEAAALAPGEHVLDVGCGTGPTTRDAARAVGASGVVTGLDIAADMLTAAAAVDPGQEAGPIEWVAADAVTWDAPAGRFDAVISRFGVMFFSDPDIAFANLAAATRPGGRLAIGVWAPRPESPLFEVPLQAALAVRRRHGHPDPTALDPLGGPFSLGDADATATLLAAAGWREVQVAAHDLAMPFSGTRPTDAAAAAADFGPTRLALEGLDATTCGEAFDAVATALTPYTDGTAALVGRVLVFTARR